MKANEFVKKFGWSSLLIAKTLPKFNRYKYVIFYADEIDFSNEFHAGRKSYMFETQEVKRLVESHELVKVWQLPEDDNDETGVDGARIYLECYAFYSTDEEKAKLERLEQAIADVESCQ